MVTTSAAGVGLVRPRPNPDAALRLLCFPYAGGGSSVFASWPERLSPHTEVCAVQLPGRESRIMQRPFSGLDRLLPALGEAVADYCREPFAFFGHSMGAIVAFELARWMRARGWPEPAHLFVSARRAPQLPHNRPLIHALPDDQFLDRVRQLGGTPAELLADTRMMAVFLPVLRADFAVNDAYAYRPERPLGCPITACGGLSDADVDQNGLMAWQQQTTGPFSLYLFRGGHFYLQPSRDTLLRAVDNALHRTLMRDRRAAPAG